jgi:hypothetical protein
MHMDKSSFIKWFICGYWRSIDSSIIASQNKNFFTLLLSKSTMSLSLMLAGPLQMITHVEAGNDNGNSNLGSSNLDKLGSKIAGLELGAYLMGM